MSSVRYHVRDVLRMDLENVKGVEDIHELEFDDNSVIVSRRNETIYSRLFWDIFSPYPTVPILPIHHVQTVLKGKGLSANTHLKLCTAILKSIVRHEGLVRPESKEPLLKRIYEVISDAMAYITELTEENVVSIDILDFVQIAKHPVITGYRLEAYHDPKHKVKYAYEKTIEAIRSLPEFKDNGLAKAVRSRMVKDNQVVQCIAFRGYPTEVDGAIYHRPNFGSYTLGNTSLYNFVSDSRTAAKSHYYSDGALQDSEYMARKIQLYSNVFKNIVFEDCGSGDLGAWTVRGVEYDEAGAVSYSGDLGVMIGKYYKEDPLDEDFKIIDGSEEHLIGKTIYFRSILKCKSKDKHYPCRICAGELYNNISRFDNVGHVCASTTTKPVTQSIISIKHVNTSSTMVRVKLKEHERAFMNTGGDGTCFRFNSDLKSMRPRLVVARDEALGLVDIKNITNIEQISLTRISKLTEVQLITLVKEKEFVIQLDVTQKLKPSMFSREFLSYIKKKKWKVDDRSNFVFDLSDWDFDLPIFVMPNNEESFVDLSNAVETLIAGSTKYLYKRTMPEAPMVLLQELFDIVNAKLRVNILALEGIIYGLMVESERSYAMGQGSPTAVLGLRDQVIFYRSLGAGLAYEQQNNILTDPISYYKGKKPDSPMDVFLLPKEVLKDRYGI